jgi:hypothetical protein
MGAIVRPSHAWHIHTVAAVWLHILRGVVDTKATGTLALVEVFYGYRRWVRHGQTSHLNETALVAVLVGILVPGCSRCVNTADVVALSSSPFHLNGEHHYGGNGGAKG